MQAKIKRDIEEYEECNFKPKLNEKTREISASRSDMSKGSFDTFYA